MKKVSISLVLLCLILLYCPIAANSENIYSVDANGNWVYNANSTQNTSTQYQQNSQTYNTNQYNQNQYNSNQYNQNPVNGQNYYYSNTYSTPNQIEDYNVPYNIQIETTNKQPFNVNLSTADLNTMVNLIGDNILNKNRIGKGVKFTVKNENTINANTGITNTVTVYKGLIQYCENEDELAFVIGHEVGHAAKNHVIKTYGVNVATGLAGQYASQKLSERIGNKWGRLATQVGIELSTEAVQNKVSRNQEKDADMLAIDYVVAAGYNPLAGISIMNKIGENYPDFWSDHPSTDKRIISMYKYIKIKYPEYLQEGFDTYSYKQALSNYL